MTRTRQPEAVENLPEPITLTPDQIREIVTATAGGHAGVRPLVMPSIIRAGGIKAGQ